MSDKWDDLDQTPFYVKEGFNSWTEWNISELKKDKENRDALLRFASDQLSLPESNTVIKGHTSQCRCPRCGPKGDIGD